MNKEISTRIFMSYKRNGKCRKNIFFKNTKRSILVQGTYQPAKQQNGSKSKTTTTTVQQ